MRKQQLYLLGGAFTLLICLIIFGKTVNPKKEIATPANVSTASSFNFSELLTKAKATLDSNLRVKIKTLEAATNMASNDTKLNAFKQLATLWKDSAQIIEPYLFYTAEAAKLENSEKTLTFAAQQYVSSMLDVDEPAMQNWFATNAKVLFDKALTINPNNDSSKIGLGACYILGNISDNPMTGLKPIKDIITQQPNNLYAHYILGLGGKKSGQFAKAIEHFIILNSSEPKNVIYILHLAECYEQAKEIAKAKTYYTKAKDLIDNDEIKKEIEKRIKDLK